MKSASASLVPPTMHEMCVLENVTLLGETDVWRPIVRFGFVPTAAHGKCTYVARDRSLVPA